MFKINFRKPNKEVKIIQRRKKESTKRNKKDDTVELATELQLKNNELMHEVINSLIK